MIALAMLLIFAGCLLSVGCGVSILNEPPTFYSMGVAIAVWTGMLAGVVMAAVGVGVLLIHG